MSSEPSQEERDAGDEAIWDWVKKQPQAVWLNIARQGNWDEWEPYFIDMVERPDCDLALASYLFWKSEPSVWLKNNERPRDRLTGELMTHILDRAEGQGWQITGLHYQRFEVADEAFRTAEVIEQAKVLPFAIPRQLCASFDGTNSAPVLQGDFDESQFEPFSDMFDTIDVTDDGQNYVEWARQGGNLWYEPALRLPESPVATPEMSDLEAIEAVFGSLAEFRPRLSAVEQERERYYAEKYDKQYYAGLRKRVNAAEARQLRPWWASVSLFVAFNLAGASAMIAALHFLGSVAAVVALAVWIAAMLVYYLR